MVVIVGVVVEGLAIGIAIEALMLFLLFLSLEDE